MGVSKSASVPGRTRPGIAVASVGEVFSIDLRTLALFRILLGTYLLWDIVLRSFDLAAHYTDWGAVPRWLQLDHLSVSSFSLHMANGSAPYQAVLFALAFVCAVLLVVGWRTRLMTVLGWVLLMSVQNRNTFVLSGEDNLAALMCFWGMFLPLGARWSVDAALDRSGRRVPDRLVSVATAAILLQGMSMYFFSALLKSDPVWGEDGTAVYYALHLDYFATPFAHWLRQFEELLQGLTWYVWTLELLGPILIFSPILHRALRVLILLAFVSMHVGFALCLEIGLFPFISIAMNLLFVPGWMWDALALRIRRRERRVTVWYDRDCGFCLKMCRLLQLFLVLPSARIRPAQDDGGAGELLTRTGSWVVEGEAASAGRDLRTGWAALRTLVAASPVFRPVAPLMAPRPIERAGDRVYGWIARNRGTLARLFERILPWNDGPRLGGRATSALAGFFLGFVTVQNLSTLPDLEIELPGEFRALRQALNLYQNWTMFAPYPEAASVRPIIVGQTKDGRTIDVLRGTVGSSATNVPVYASREYSGARWRKFLSNLEDTTYRTGDNPRLLAYARFLCRLDGQRSAADASLTTFRIAFGVTQTPPPGDPKIEEIRTVWTHDCSV